MFACHTMLIVISLIREIVWVRQPCCCIFSTPVDVDLLLVLTRTTFIPIIRQSTVNCNVRRVSSLSAYPGWGWFNEFINMYPRPLLTASIMKTKTTNSIYASGTPVGLSTHPYLLWKVKTVLIKQSKTLPYGWHFTCGIMCGLSHVCFLIRTPGHHWGKAESRYCRTSCGVDNHIHLTVWQHIKTGEGILLSQSTLPRPLDTFYFTNGWDNETTCSVRFSLSTRTQVYIFIVWAFCYIAPEGVMMSYMLCKVLQLKSDTPTLYRQQLNER